MDKNILLIEDDEGLNTGIKYSFKKEGFNIMSASTVAEGKRLFSPKIDLVILDVGLPDGNGLDFCISIRKESSVPIIMLTAHDLETDEISGFIAGADDYITKPFSLAVLHARVEVLLRRTSTEPDTAFICFDDFKIDTKQCRFYHKDTEITVSMTELKLLSYFLTNPEIVLTKEQILSFLWDSNNNFVDENTLAVNISRLRNKIEKDKKNPRYIKTIHGIGYIWCREG